MESAFHRHRFYLPPVDRSGCLRFSFLSFSLFILFHLLANEYGQMIDESWHLHSRGENSNARAIFASYGFLYSRLS